jgi:hypothetical protein
VFPLKFNESFRHLAFGAKYAGHARERAGSDSVAAIYAFDDPARGRFLKRTPGPPPFSEMN